ncbi:MAG: NAD(P)-binding domain-containing protein [Gammaproteobacteria bacterium]|nr:NAD(P)-binding domain-containing protein [Gammaproteobacteria bacterium]
MKMSEITLIGLGSMGQAIAKTLLDHNVALTVWNRTAEKREALVNLGARGESDLGQAISASPLIIICVSDYAITHALLDQSEIVPLLRGKTILQLSTGTPGEVRKAHQWVVEQGGRYLDGSIMVYPQTVGTEAGQLLVSGAEAVYRDCETYLGLLGGDVRYLGEEIGAAAALDLAVVSRLTAITPGVIHGALICEAEGVSLEQFAAMYPPGDRAYSLAMTIHNNDFESNIAASVNVAIGVATSIKRQSQELGINSDFPDFQLSLYKRAVAAGFQNQDTASQIRVLRADTSN